MIQVIDNPHNNLSPAEISDFSRYFTVEDVLQPHECDELVSEGLSRIFSAEKKHTYKTSMKLEHCFLPKDHTLHNKLLTVWEYAIKKFKFDITFIEPYKLQTYPVDGYFDRHIDNYHGLSLPVDRKLSMTLQLSDDLSYGGGDLVVGHHRASRKKGSATFFPSFYPHKVETVTSGRRWCVVGWAWGPYWR